MRSAMDTFWKVVLFTAFGPLVAVMALHLVAAVLLVVLPYAIVLAAVVGVTAGLSAGLVLRRRLAPPRRGPEEALPVGPAPEPVRRPRGPGRRREE